MASSSSSSEPQEKICQIEHFLHDHPLIFFENLEEQLSCQICDEFIIDGPRYGCIRCSFYVHKSCGELPKQVRNMLHPKHLLELSRKHDFLCDACSRDFCCSSYRCMQCDFDLDIRCVLEHIFEEPQGHKDHTFKILMPTLFTCGACGVEEVNKYISCVCTTCQLQVHKICTDTYPFTVKEPRHNHLLKLTYSFQTNPGFANKICKICFLKMNDVHFMYSCADCDYFTHVKCGVSTNTLHDDGQVLESEYKVFGIDALELKETPRQQIEHFSHRPHSLIFNTNGPNKVILCNGCVRPISEPFYSCDQCNFFLHRYCAELKKKIQHPLHIHKLTLRSGRDILRRIMILFPDRIIGHGATGIKCYGCRLQCNGFMYSCGRCSFYLDVGCSLLSDISSHEGHKCTLTLIDMYQRHKSDNPDYETNCSACGLNCLNKFVCERCNFNLDLQCASLPKLIPHECPKHDWNLHPFELMYKAIEDGRSGKHYCDVCEEERNENHWFYYCQDCDYSAHPRCILGHDRVKYGSSCKLNTHPHFVCFLKTTNGNHTCKECSQPCEKGEPVFTCKECDVYFHYICTFISERME